METEKHSTGKRILSFVMTVVMVFTMIPTLTFAFLGSNTAKAAYPEFTKKYPTEYYYPEGTKFISNFGIYYSKIKATAVSGIKKAVGYKDGSIVDGTYHTYTDENGAYVNLDAAKGTHGLYYIYIGYTLVSDPAAAEVAKGVRFYVDQNKNDSPVLNQSGVDWYQCNNGDNDIYNPDITGDGAVDLNKGAGGDYVYLFATYDRNFGPAISVFDITDADADTPIQRENADGWKDCVSFQDNTIAAALNSKISGSDDIYAYYYSPCKQINTDYLRDIYSKGVLYYAAASKYESSSVIKAALDDAKQILEDVDDGYTTFDQEAVDNAFAAVGAAMKDMQLNDDIAENGGYYVTIEGDCPNGASHSSEEMRVYYREKNGTGVEKYIIVDRTSGNWTDDNCAPVYNFLCPGFPTKLEFKAKIDGGLRKMEYSLSVKVGNGKNDPTVIFISDHIEHSSGLTDSSSFSDVFVIADDVYPKIETLSIEGVEEYDPDAGYTCNSFHAGVYDQYGTEMTADVEWRIEEDPYNSFRVSSVGTDAYIYTDKPHLYSDVDTVTLAAEGKWKNKTAEAGKVIHVKPSKRYMELVNLYYDMGIFLQQNAAGGITENNGKSFNDYLGELKDVIDGTEVCSYDEITALINEFGDYTHEAYIRYARACVLLNDCGELYTESSRIAMVQTVAAFDDFIQKHSAVDYNDAEIMSELNDFVLTFDICLASLEVDVYFYSDGEKFFADTVHVEPVRSQMYTPETVPVKTGYDFVGWSSSEDGESIGYVVDILTGNRFYALTEVHKYNICFMDEKGRYLQNVVTEHGKMPEYTDIIPEKEFEEQYHYVFTGWDPVPVPAFEDTDYRIVYTTEPHKYEVNTVPSTCTKSGVETKICSCGKKIESVIEPLGHNYIQTVVEATQDEEAYLIFTCDRCGAKYTTEIPPVAPEGFIGFPAVNSVELSWLRAVESTVTGYEIYRQAPGEDEFTLLKKISSRDTLSFVDTNLLNENEYKYKLRAVKGQLAGEFSDIISVSPVRDTTKPVVYNVTPANYSIKAGTFAVTASARDDIGVTSFIVSLSSDKGDTWSQIYETAASSLSFSFRSKEYPDGEYIMKIVASDKEGNLSDGFMLNFALDNSGPSVPGNLSASVVYSSKLTLTWNDVPDKDRAGFILQQKKNGQFVTVNSNIRTIGYNVSGLTPDTEYTFRVAAFDSLGNAGEYSDEFTVRTAADTTAPVITKQSPSPSRYSKKITFSATASDDCGIENIRIETSVDRTEWTTVYSSVQSGAATASISYAVDVSAADEGTLYIRAVAVDIAGNVSDESASAPFIEYYIDHTAPAAPTGVSAVSGDGYIGINWDNGKENDIASYSLYRAGDDGRYSLVASSLNTLNYYDRSVERGKTYKYKVCACDTAGNVSEYSAEVSAVAVQDVVKPEIKSISPAGNSFVGPQKNTVSVLASDNNTLDKIVIEYKSEADKDFKVLKEFTGINNYYKTVSALIPVDEFSHGDAVYVRAYCVDTASLNSGYSNTVKYVVDKSAPGINDVSYELNGDQFTLSWKDCDESDLAGFRIYRKVNNGAYVSVASRSKSTAHTYSMTNTLEPGVYVYKIEAVDTTGNIQSIFTEEISVGINSKIDPVIDVVSYFEAGVREVFSAGRSSAAAGIKAYYWNFGDGTSSDKKEPTKAYNEAGTYTVSLTITDNFGKTASTAKEITVNERNLMGISVVKVVSTGGSPLAGMPVYFDLGEKNQQIKYTDSKGCASMTLPVGSHVVGTYAGGYLPDSKTVTVLSGETITTVLTAEKRNIIDGEFHVREMTLDEIVAAGIDVSDPANQQVYHVDAVLIFGTQKVPVSYVRNDTQIIDIKIDDFDLGGGKKVPNIKVQYIPNVKNQEIIAVLVMPIQASYLKQFFEAELTIYNNAAEEFRLIDCGATIDVPDGLTLVGGSGMDSVIPGQSSSTETWILRGDKAGRYKLSSHFNGMLENFNVPVSASFTAPETVEVYGPDSVKLRIEVGDIKDGHLRFNVGLYNKRPVPLNCPKIKVGPFVANIVEAYKKMLKNEDILDEDIKELSLRVLDCVVLDSSGNGTIYETDTDDYVPVDVIAPNGALKYEYQIDEIIEEMGDYFFTRGIIDYGEDYYGSSVEIVRLENAVLSILPDQYTKEHLDFVASPAYHSMAAVNFAKEMDIAVDESFENKWLQYVMELDITDVHGEKYNDIVVSKLILDLCDVDNAYDKFNDCALSKYNEYLGLAAKGIYKDIQTTWPDFKENKIVDILDGADFDSGEYKMFENALKKLNQEKKLDVIFKGYDIAGNLMDIYDGGVDIVNNVRNYIKYASVLSTCAQMNSDLLAGFDAIIEELEASGSKQALNSMKKYFASVSDPLKYKAELIKKGLNCGLKVVFSAASFLYKDLLKDALEKMTYDIMIKLGYSAAEATSALSSVAIEVLILKLGTDVIKGITNSGAIAEQLGLLGANGDYAEASHSAMEAAKDKLLADRTYESAVAFDAAFTIYKAIQLTAFNAFNEYGKAKLDAAVIKFMEYFHLTDKSEWREIIKEITVMQQKYSSTYCHIQGHEVAGGGTKLIEVACPTTVYVYSDSGELLVKASNDEIINNTDIIAANTANNVKFIAMPCDVDYNIVIDAEDDGAMAYNVYEYGENSKRERQVSFAEIAIEKGDAFTGIVDNVMNTPAENYTLTKNGTEEYAAENDNTNCVNEFYLTTEDVVLDIMQTTQVEYVINPETCTNNNVDFTIIDTSVATVDANGVIKALKAGTTVLEAVTEDGHFYDSITITVSECEHIFGEWIITEDNGCEKNGSAYRTCSLCGEKEEKTLDPNGHSVESIAAVAPTCVKDGATEGSRCSVCGKVLIIPEVIKAGGHKAGAAVTENVRPVTCTSKGSRDIVIYCSVCKTELSRQTVTDDSYGHNFVISEKIEAGCNYDGCIISICDICGELSKQMIPARGHYDTDGDGYCDSCGKMMSVQNNCSHMCHKTGFMGFLWKIVNFFQRLFKSGQYCSCGVAHW